MQSCTRSGSLLAEQVRKNCVRIILLPFNFLFFPSVFLKLPFHHHGYRFHLTVPVSSRLIYCNAHKGMSVLTSDHLHENTDLQRCILHKPWVWLTKWQRVIFTKPRLIGLFLVLKEPEQIFLYIWPLSMD